MKRHHKTHNILRKPGFSVVELVVVMVVLSTLALMVTMGFRGSRERTYQSATQTDLLALANAAQLYANKYNAFPGDTSRSVPNGLSEFIDPAIATSIWSTGTYPGSVFDWDAWDLLDASTNTRGSDGINDTFQVSLRFCPASGSLSTCHFPSETWANGFGVDSAAYYCVKGYCRSHGSQPYSYPGYCYNCPGHTAVTTPDGQ